MAECKTCHRTGFTADELVTHKANAALECLPLDPAKLKNHLKLHDCELGMKFVPTDEDKALRARIVEMEKQLAALLAASKPATPAPGSPGGPKP